jgi:2-iminobutanoate/2-iminopropanoate deaminase
MARLATSLMFIGGLSLTACNAGPLNSEHATWAVVAAERDAGREGEHQSRSLGQELVPPGTPNSPGVLIGNTLYVAGLQGTDLETHKLPQDFAQEVKNCLDNVGRVLKDGGMGYDNVVSDISKFQQVNGIYAEYIKSPSPARTTVQVAKLSSAARIEISAIAQR